MSIDIEEIRRIAERYSPEEISGCVCEELETGRLTCVVSESNREMVEELSRSGFVRGLTEKGVALAEALRKLAARVSQLQKGQVDGDQEAD